MALQRSLRLARPLQRSGHHVLFVRRDQQLAADPHNASLPQQVTKYNRVRLADDCVVSDN